MAGALTSTHDAAFLWSGGEMSALIRSCDWAATPLGPMERWPQDLKTAAGIMLASPGPVSILWGPERIQLYNDAYIPIAAERHPEALGRPAAENWSEAYEHFLGPIFDRVFAGETVEVDEHAVKLRARGDGLEDRFFTGSFLPVVDEEGKVGGVFHPLLEVTGKARADAALRDREERLSRVLDGMAEGFGLLAPDFTILEHNAEALRLDGRTREEIVGRSHWEAYPGTEDSELGRLLKCAMAERRAVSLEHRYAFANGRVRWLEMRAHPASHDALAVFWRDVTDRKEAEERLRASEARQAFMLDLSDALRPLADANAMQAEGCRLLGAYLDVAQVGFAEVDADEEHIAVHRDWTDGRIPSVVGSWRLDDFGPQFVRVMKAGETIVIPDITLDPRTDAPEVVAAYESIATRAILDVPLVKDGSMTALLFIHHPEPRRWTSEEVRLAEEVCGRLWSAVQRAHAEGALRVERELLNTVIAQAPVGISIAEAPSGRAITINDKAVELLGHTQNGEEAERYESYGAIHADGRPYAVDDYPTVRAIRHGEVVDGEDMLYRRGGAEGPEITRFAVSSAPVRDRAGNIVAAATVFIDVEERRRAEEALRESETRFRLMADAVPQFVWITDRRGRMEFLNRQFTDYTGAPREAWTAAELATNFMHPQDGPKFAEAFDAALAASASFEIEHRIRSAAGEDRWFLARAEPYRDPQTGEIVRWFGASVDIHDRRQAEAALRDSEARYRTLFETIDAGFCVIEVMFDAGGRATDYRFVEANPAFERQTGLQGAVGRTVRELVPNLEPRWFDAYGRVALTGEAVRFEDGSAAMGRWFDAHALRVGEPQARRVAILFNDISARREVEERLRELNDTLEARVVERTAELETAQEALRHSQKLDAMGQLTGGVAHDFNNLLTPILGSLDMLQRKGLGDERERRLIDGALQSAERAKTLVQRLLAFARRQPLQPGPVDLRRLVGGMAELVASTSGPKVEVRVDLPDDLPPATADANQLEMAVLNLAVNARDAMPEGGALTISGSRESVRLGHPAKLRPGHYVRLSVSDTGMGMDEATLARAVEPFFSTKGVGRGTGLGLSMVHGLALQLNGGLTLRSRPGEGTTVALWLPISAVAAQDEDRALDPAAPREALGTALLVDDEELVRMSAADMLADLGYEVVEAGSAEEALRLIGDGLEPDLLVTDHLMPGMNGEELARALRLDRPALPVLIVSGYADAAGIAPGLPRLTKPFRSAEFAASVAALTPAGAGRGRAAVDGGSSLRTRPGASDAAGH